MIIINLYYRVLICGMLYKNLLLGLAYVIRLTPCVLDQGIGPDDGKLCLWTTPAHARSFLNCPGCSQARMAEVTSCNRDSCCCSVAKSCLTLCDLMDCSTPGFPVLHYLPKFAQTHVHWVDDAIWLSHPLSSPSPPALNFSQHQGLFKWVSSLHQVAKVLELQLQHQSF